MLQLIQNKDNKKEKRNWTLIETDEFGNFKGTVVELRLIVASITNKFNIVNELLTELCDLIPGFELWFKTLIKRYVESNNNSEILLKQADNFLLISEEYINKKNIIFSNFSKIEKSSKTSIMFLAEDIRAIAISSTCLKLYSIFCYSDLKLVENLHKLFYEKLISPCVELKTTDKIFQIIRSRTYRSNITDRKIWDIVKMRQFESPESHGMVVFNFMMTNMLSTLSVDKNPIPYLVSVIDDSIMWMTRTIYKDKIIYGEIFGGTDDIYGSSLSKESFYLYCCNNVLGDIAKITMSILENDYGLTDTQYDQIRDRIESIDSLIPSVKLVTFPIASKVLEIPYKFLLTCPPKHAILLGIFIHHMAKEILDEKYPIISNLLLAYPTDLSTEVVKSEYTIKNIELLANNNSPVFGFGQKLLRFNLLSPICGMLSASKKNLISVINGKPLSKISSFDLENDLVTFFTYMYNNQLDSTFDKIREKADSYF